MINTCPVFKRGLTGIIPLFIMVIITSCGIPREKIIGKGLQPQVTMDMSGTIRIIFGNEDRIYCATSTDNGYSFPDIQQVGEISEMHLGLSRGPQVATSKDYTMVSAIDKKGTIHAYQLNHNTREWSKVSVINDVEYSAPEGLMSIASDQNNYFYAVWLDIRQDKHNKICFAATMNQGRSWIKNRVVYRSPDGTVCECCKPNITVSRSKIFIMFRNWLNGSRDLYLIEGDKIDEEFGKPEKLGFGTWKLDACPMDGGGLIFDGDKVLTVWQRNGVVYLAIPGESERQISSGRNCSISNSRDPLITWQQGKKLKLQQFLKGRTVEVGTGDFLRALKTKNGNILCSWENEEEIIIKQIKL
jgi:hypothetical protein